MFLGLGIIFSNDIQHYMSDDQAFNKLLGKEDW
jgi:hypothetical protein